MWLFSLRLKINNNSVPAQSGDSPETYITTLAWPPASNLVYMTTSDWQPHVSWLAEGSSSKNNNGYVTEEIELKATTIEYLKNIFACGAIL